jgi:hypothetical protein
VPREGISGREAMETLENTKSGASIRRDIDDSHLLTGGSAAATAILSNLVRQTELAA